MIGAPWCKCLSYRGDNGTAWRCVSRRTIATRGYAGTSKLMANVSPGNTQLGTDLAQGRSPGRKGRPHAQPPQVTVSLSRVPAATDRDARSEQLDDR